MLKLPDNARKRKEGPMSVDAQHWIPSRRALLAGLAGAAALLMPAVAAGPAGATGPFWPGETLSLAQTSPAVLGQVTNFVASGTDPDIAHLTGGVTLEVFAKDPSIDPTCASSYIGEQSTNATEVNERWVTMLLPEASDQAPGPFNVPFKIQFDRPGPTLLCAYSKSVLSPDTDDGTLAAAQLPVNVGGGGTPLPTATAPGRPANTKKPHVRRSGKLTCNPGTWSNSPTGYAYRWLVNGKSKHGASRRRLSVGRKLRGRKVQCKVTASNAAGRTTAVSRAYRVR